MTSSKTPKMKRLLIILLILHFCTYPFNYAFAEEPSYDSYQITEDDHRKSRYARMVEERIAKIERAVQEINESYKNKSIWDPPNKEALAKETHGQRVKRHILLVPTYIIRFATWPVAAIGNALIKKGVVKKTVDIISNDDRTLWVYPRLELGFGSGFGGGIGLHHFDLFHKELELSSYYQIHVNMNQEAKVSLKKPDAFYIGDKPMAFNAGTEIIHHNDTDFFGVGIQAPRSNETKYGIDGVTTGGWLGYGITDNFMLRGNSFFIWNSSRRGKGGAPSAETVFSTSTLTGYGRSLYYAAIGLALIHDTRDSDVVPETGGIRKISFTRFQGLNTIKFDYNEYMVSATQFFRILEPRNVLAFNSSLLYQQQTAGDGIPFYRLAKLDMNSPLRGFDYGRFTDRGRVVFNIEYSFPVWDFMDGQVFFDTGRVFHTLTDFSFRHFKFSGGVGLNLRTSELYLLRVQAGFSDEGAKVLIRTSREF